MKQGRNLTVKESIYIKSLKLKPENWLLSKKLSREWHVINRKSGKLRVVQAP